MFIMADSQEVPFHKKLTLGHYHEFFFSEEADECDQGLWVLASFTKNLCRVFR